MFDSSRRDARQSAGRSNRWPGSINHGFLLFRSVAQAADLIGLQNGFIHRCHRLPKYDAYEIHRPESSGGAWDPAYTRIAETFTRLISTWGAIG